MKILPSFPGSAWECIPGGSASIEDAPTRRSSMGRSRYKTLQEFNTYFATCTTVNWLPLFNKPELAQIVMDSLQYLHEKNRLTLHAYVLLEDHLHLVGTSADFSAEMRSFKSFTARSIVDWVASRGPDHLLESLRFHKARHKTDQTHQVWQEGYHPEAVQNMKMLSQKIDYIHANPVRRGYVDEPSQWRYSSARQYEGLEGLVPVELPILH